MPSQDVPVIASTLGVRICDLYGVEEPHAGSFQPTDIDRFTATVTRAWPTFAEPEKELLEVVGRAVAAYLTSKNEDMPA